MAKSRLDEEVSRFLEAWLGVRQLIQAANFNRFQREGLSATQFMTLNLVPVEGDGVTLSELAKRMNLTLATLAKTVDSLESRGMLTRTRSESDRRVVHIALTRRGKELQNAASKGFKSYMAELFRGVGAAQRRGLIEGLESLIRAQTTREGRGAATARRSSRVSRKL